MDVELHRIPGHWEGDLIIGLMSAAIGTLVERTTRFTLLLHLFRMKSVAMPGKPTFTSALTSQRSAVCGCGRDSGVV